MKILIVTQYFWPETFRINDIASSLVRRGHEVTVLTGTPNYPEGKFFKGFGWLQRRSEYFKGVKIWRVPIIPRGKGSNIQLFLNYLSYALSASLFGPIVSPTKIDIILVFQVSPVTIGIPGLVMKKLKKAPLFFWVQDLWPESISAVGVIKPSSLLLKPIEKLVRFLYARSDRILVQSKAFESAIRIYQKDIKSFYYLPNCAEEIYKPILPDKETAEFKQMPKGFCIMFAGNIGVAQDFDTILRTAKILEEYKNIQWVILGDGRDRIRVEQKVLALNLSKVFHFLGKYPIEKMPTYFSFADVLLVTLKKDPIFALTIPAKIQSYLACCKPIVASLDGEGSRIVEESDAGLTCNAEDPDALAAKILKMYRMPNDERNRMGEAGRKYFLTNFESEMLVSRLEDWMIEEKNQGLPKNDLAGT
jgi:colanic acid biosynthesis glycosyl transferase WcaI